MKIHVKWQDVRHVLYVAGFFALFSACMATGPANRERFHLDSFGELEAFLLVTGGLMALFLWPMLKDLIVACWRVLTISGRASTHLSRHGASLAHGARADRADARKRQTRLLSARARP